MVLPKRSENSTTTGKPLEKSPKTTITKRKYASKRRKSMKSIARKARASQKTKQKLQGEVEKSRPLEQYSVAGSSCATHNDTSSSPMVTNKTSGFEEKKSASWLKLGTKGTLGDDEINFNYQEGFRIIDVDILNTIIRDSICPVCKVHELDFAEKDTERKGLSNRFHIVCHGCNYENKYFSSKRVATETPVKGGSAFEANVRFGLAMRTIGKGFADMTHFCGIMNIPPPMKEETYQNLQESLYDAATASATESMAQAAKDLRKDEPVTETTIMIDGTWQRRGHSSLNGVVTAISMENGKVLDYEVLSKSCKGCQIMSSKDKSSLEYKQWEVTHQPKCKKTHDGSAPSMEPAGAIRIFQRSEAQNNLQYLGYVGDGDTKSYSAVVSAEPYPGKEILKKECVGHVQKRVGSRLRKLKQNTGKKKLSDGKTLGGKGRLTDKEIDNLQLYYGLAIRRNVGDLNGMKESIRAILRHKGSTDENFDHSLCPSGKDSWCGWQKDKASGTCDYKHKHSLPPAVIEAVTPVFDDLCKDELLEKCLDGFTQNACESFNALIWKRCPKEVYSGRNTVSTAVSLAVGHFNDGTFSIINILTKLGIEAGPHTRKWAKSEDHKRLQQSQKKCELVQKKIRQSLRQSRKESEEKNTEKEGITYEAGAF